MSVKGILMLMVSCMVMSMVMSQEEIMKNEDTLAEKTIDLGFLATLYETMFSAKSFKSIIVNLMYWMVFLLSDTLFRNI